MKVEFIDYRPYNLNYTPAILGVRSRREVTSGGTPATKVDYHWSGILSPVLKLCRTENTVTVTRRRCYFESRWKGKKSKAIPVTGF
jgi:hypothetical protein